MSDPISTVTGHAEQPWSTNHAMHTLGDLGTGFGVVQNHVDTGITTTRRTIVFPEGAGPTKINVRLVAATGENAFIVINASSDQHADNELADPVSQDAVTERYTVFESEIQPQGIEIASVTPIDRIDYLMPVDAGTATLYVEGA